MPIKRSQSARAILDIFFSISPFLPIKTDLVIPAEGGSYYFEVEAIEAIETKTSFWNFLRAFEYRVMVDENITEQELLQISAVNDYIEPGDKYKVEFEVPENAEQQERNIRVDILLAKDNTVYDSFYGNDDHVDPGDNTWETIWEAVKASFQSGTEDC